jgi:hypothetical protein
VLKDFLSDLFPKNVLDYIPGQKLIAGLVVYIAAEAFGVTAEVISLPVIGEVNIPELATLLAVYLWPTNEQIA